MKLALILSSLVILPAFSQAETCMELIEKNTMTKVESVVQWSCMQTKDDFIKAVSGLCVEDAPSVIFKNYIKIKEKRAALALEFQKTQPGTVERALIINELGALDRVASANGANESGGLLFLIERAAHDCRPR